MIKKDIYGKILATTAAMIIIAGAHGQKRTRANDTGDTLSLLKEFVSISNIYQKTPLYLEVYLINSTNFITGEADTASINAIFYTRKENSYIRFGEAEQFVNDSLALVVSDKLQRMVLYSDAAAVLRRMQSIKNILAGDSSLHELARRFHSKHSSPDAASPVITLSSRDAVSGTGLPREVIDMQYDPVSRQPVKVTTIKRSLLPISEDDYKTLQARPDLTGKLLSPEGRGHFLIKEQKGEFIYKQINHKVDLQLPATMADRITKTETGEFIPVKKYEAYALTHN